MGILLIGFSLFDPIATAGASIYLIFHGFIKGALFINSGTLLHVFSGVDEFELRSRGKETPITGVLFGIGGLLLAGLPPFGLGLGKSFIESAAERLDYSWVSILLIFPSALTGGAVLRATGRIFLGLGKIEGEERTGATESEKQETTGKHGHALWFMIAPAAALTAFAIFGGFYPQLEQNTKYSADLFQDWAGYQKSVLEDRSVPVPIREGIIAEKRTSQWKGFIPPVGAVCLALFSLYAGSMPKHVYKGILKLTHLPSKKLQQLHSGHVGDYVAWLAVGVAIFGIFLFLNFLRR
jgi:multicomponent Na+:H+ antiporter subunit D